MKSSILKSIIPIIIASAFVIGIVYSATWTAPTCGPTGCNTETPINVSGSGQIKNGGLTVGAALDSTSTGFVVLNGLTGIGKMSPNYKLDVNGYVNTESGFCIRGDCKNSWMDIAAGGDVYTQGSTSTLSVDTGWITGTSYNSGNFGICSLPGKTRTFTGTFTLFPVPVATPEINIKVPSEADDTGSGNFERGSRAVTVSCTGSGGNSFSISQTKSQQDILSLNSSGYVSSIPAYLHEGYDFDLYYNFGGLKILKNLNCNYTVVVTRTDSDCQTRVRLGPISAQYDDYRRASPADTF